MRPIRKSLFTIVLSSALFLSSNAQWTTSGTNIYNSNSGSVGIGTTSPLFKLHVEGSAGFLTGISRFYLYEGGTFDPALAGLRVNGGSMVLQSKDAGTLYFNRDVNATTSIQATVSGTTYDLATFKPNGLVGLGTATPRGVFDVAGSGDIFLSNMPNGGATQKIYIPANIYMAPNGATDVAYLQARRQSDAGSTSLRIRTMNNGAVTEAIHITSTGGVGINTTEPYTHKLAVNGSAIFTSAYVKAIGAWPDFVFENDYNLPSLSYIEDYIIEHKHLPDVPSAEEVKNNGINLGENQALLLKKIEELTLYVIEQNKRIEQQELKIDELSKKINDTQAGK